MFYRVVGSAHSDSMFLTLAARCPDLLSTLQKYEQKYYTLHTNIELVTPKGLTNNEFTYLYFREYKYK